MEHPYVVIVDAYSTGQYLAPKFQSHGYRCIHVQSTPDIAPIFQESFHADNFDIHLVLKQGSELLLNQLKKYSILCVIPGTETGVLLADFLSARLGVLSNGTKMSNARRNKFAMVETLQAAGIKTVSHSLNKNIDEVLAWQKQIDQFPIVLKPEQSAGADHVFFCYSEQEIKNCFNKILDNKTIFNAPNQAVLAQTFLSGTEYIVNTTSSHGVHHITEIWQCHKERVLGSGFISLMEELVPFQLDFHSPITTYAKQILDALEIQHGPGHFEIMLTDTGPVLVEVAARMQGCVDPQIIEAAMDGDSVVSLAIDSYVNPEKIMKKAKQAYSLKQHVYRVFMKSHVDGILVNTPDTSPIKNLQSFASLKTNMKKGSAIHKTRDIATSPGVIHLISSDPLRLKQDYEKYRKIEESLWLAR